MFYTVTNNVVIGGPFTDNQLFPVVELADNDPLVIAFYNSIEASHVTQQSIGLSDLTAKQIAQSDAVIQYLINHTPAECSDYVAANVTNLATAVSLLQKMAMALSVLAKQGLR